jgi:16S rRNA processing protein RimM
MGGDEPALVEVGVVGRPHGLRGEVVVRLTTNNLDRVAVGSVLLADGGELVVRTSRRHGNRWIVGFEGVGDREGAEALAGTLLRAERVEDDPDGYWVHDLVGATVSDAEGVERGVVTEVLDNPASDLLVLTTGVLVPLRFATWDGPGRLVVDGPEGLWDT